MARSQQRSNVIGKSVRRGRRLLVSATAFIGLASKPKWLVVLDSSTVIEGVIARKDNPSRDLLEVAIAGVVTSVLSPSIREEVTEVLGRPKFGSWSPADVDEILGPVWAVATWVELADDDPAYLRFVRDAGDVHVLRAAAATYADAELAAAQRKFIASGDARAFRDDTRWYDFECIRPADLMRRLRDAVDA
jgi:predicted nucleic acid-binding protein